MDTKHVYWIAGQAFGPTYAGGFGTAYTLTNEVLTPHHLNPGGPLHAAIRSDFPASVRDGLRIIITSIYKFETPEAAK